MRTVHHVEVQDLGDGRGAIDVTLHHVYVGSRHWLIHDDGRGNVVHGEHAVYEAPATVTVGSRLFVALTDYFGEQAFEARVLPLYKPGVTS